MWLAAIALALAGWLGMDEILNRVAALEAADAGSRARLSQLEDEAVRSRASQQAAGMAELTARLDPGSLSQIVRPPGGTSSIPDLGQPLLARLRDDSSLPGMSGGRVDPTSAFGNVLGDPTFRTIPAAGYTLTTTDANVSDSNPAHPYWFAYYVLNSGTAPASARSLYRAYERWSGGVGLWTDNVTSSSIVFLDLTWGAAAGDITVYLTAQDYADLTSFVPSWLTAGLDIRTAGGLDVSNVDAATAYVEIVNGAGTVLAQSDPEDLLTLDDLEIASRLEAALEAPEASTAYYWRLRIDVSWSASAGYLRIAMAQPQLSWSDDGSLPQFTPAVGRWTPEVMRAVGARAYRTATQSVNDATDTAVLFDTGNAVESWDTDVFHSLSSASAQFAVPFDGLYHIDAGVGFAGNATGKRDMWIEVNADGTQRALQRELNPTGSAAYLTTSCDLLLDAGDYVRLMVAQNSGGALNVLGNGQNTFLNIHLVGVL